MSKHTPGPWELTGDPSHFDTLSSIVAGERRMTPPVRRLMVEVGGHAGYAEQEANARLIAAAPELLEALERVVKWLDTPGDGAFSDYEFNKCKAAIRKAKGE